MEIKDPIGDANPIGNKESGNSLLNKYAAGIRTRKIDKYFDELEGRDKKKLGVSIYPQLVYSLYFLFL